MLAFPCNCSCSSRAQLRNQAPLSGSSPDSLSCCSTEGKRGRAAFVRTKRTLCRAASPSTAKHASSAVEAKSAAPAKQEVVSYNGVEFEVTDKPELKSTWEHRAIVLSTTLVLGLLFARGVSHSSGLAIAACVVVGYVFAGTHQASDSPKDRVNASQCLTVSFCLLYSVVCCFVVSDAFSTSSSTARPRALLLVQYCLRCFICQTKGRSVVV